MKISLFHFLLISLSISTFTVNHVEGQQKETSTTKKDAIEVTLSPYFFETDEKTIEIIEKKEHISYDEYISLVLAYANLFADTSKIDSLIAKSISASPSRACEFWAFLMKDPKKHQITYQYFNTVKSNTNGCKDE